MNLSIILNKNEKLDKFVSNHPKFPDFIKYIEKRGLPIGTEITINVSLPDGQNIKSSIKVKDEDADFFKELLSEPKAYEPIKEKSIQSDVKKSPTFIYYIGGNKYTKYERAISDVVSYQLVETRKNKVDATAKGILGAVVAGPIGLAAAATAESEYQLILKYMNGTTEAVSMSNQEYTRFLELWNEIH